ncbi:peptidase domain-containing ABC transporter [Algoriphagus pacificus]|uniref:Peptidase domain-containing ABC transporter n=1 Tax=Algoriphagus pacificus TaxID=2811234 RepID=A0ABS3CL26_9BACT|nr:peptidase domain-containing ABC transporter [Algoriphagus pacificus]MBN7817797.1 peptidase domain-containing ABC transporter [Algoriphagus pacificus]
MRFPFYKQIDNNDCGVTCFQSISDYYSISIDFDILRIEFSSSYNGLNLNSLKKIGEQIGFKCNWYKLDLSSFIQNFSIPVIVNLKGNHYVIVYKVNSNKVFVCDPAFGLIDYDLNEFSDLWLWDHSSFGFCLECIPDENVLSIKKSYSRFKFDFSHFSIFTYLYSEIKAFKKDFLLLFIFILITSLLQFVFPIFSQKIVDSGIQNKNYNIVLLFASGYFFIFLGRRIFEFLRSFYLNRLMLKFNFSLVSKFMSKLISMPFSFFQNNEYSSLIIKLRDINRIQKLATQSSIDSFFSFITITVFSLYALYYSLEIFILICIFYILYFLWIFRYFKKRKLNDYLNFSDSSNEQKVINDILLGIKDIKITNATDFFESNWNRIQFNVVKNGMAKFKIEESQDFGSSVIKEFFFSIITIVAAFFVIDGKFSIGVYFSVQYVLGNLSAPIFQILNLTTSFQDSKISYDRVKYINDFEEKGGLELIKNDNTKYLATISNLSFKYSIDNEYALSNVSVNIPSNKKIAIVGESGSGKSTFVKLMLGFFQNYEGEINLLGNNIKSLKLSSIYQYIGVVNQDGHIFEASLKDNIVLKRGESFIKEKFDKILRIIGFFEFVYSLNEKENTMLGNSGYKLSGGQKQRILIARSLYNNPNIIIFDEATSSLDSLSEVNILSNIYSNFPNISFIFITHKVNLIKDFDMILVFKNSELISFGTHSILIDTCSYYNKLYFSNNDN